MMLNTAEAAWLAGIIDGEGSIGISKNGNGTSLRAAVQMSMTCEKTILHAIGLCKKAGVVACGYTYQEKKPEKHRDAAYLRVTRLHDIRTLGRIVAPFAVTKSRHWELILSFCDLRLEGVRIEDDGMVTRGGSRKWWKPYTEKEWNIYDEIRQLNARGPQAPTRRSSDSYGPLAA